jgi:hypothetical protein
MRRFPTGGLETADGTVADVVRPGVFWHVAPLGLVGGGDAVGDG